MDCDKIPWEVIPGIYQYQNTPFVYYQDKEVCETYVKFLCDFLDKVLNDEPDVLFRHKPVVKELLQKTKNSLSDSSDEVHWMPQYGCLWTAQDCEAHLSDEVSINMIGLDGHEYFMQVAGSNKDYKHSGNADIYKSKPLHVGLIKKEKIPDFMKAFRDFFVQASSQNQDQRSAVGNRQGHQMTPSLVHAILKQAFLSLFNNNCRNLHQKPKGGFTDVGLHTGGMPRNTSWPLACSLLHHYFNYHGKDLVDVFFVLRALMIYLDIYIIESSLVNENYKKIPRKFDGIYSIMQSVSKKMVRFANDRHDITSMYEIMVKSKEKLEAQIKNEENDDIKSYMLPSFGESYLDKYKMSNLEIKLPDNQEKLQTFISIQERKDRASSNMGVFSLFDGSSLEKLWKWLESIKKSQFQRREIMQLHNVEALLWEYSKRLTAQPLTESEVNTLIKVVDYYRDVLHEFRSLQDHAQLMTVEVNSREVLVMSVTYCLIFQSVKKIHSDIMYGFGICLNFHDLGHLVLRTKTSIDTLQGVAEFLNEHETGNPLFSLQNGDPTFALALQYGNKYLGDLLTKEKIDASHRIENHWKEVVRKQKLVAQYRQELDKIKREKLDADYDLKRAKERYNSLPYSHRDYSDKRYEMAQCTSKVEDIKDQIKRKMSLIECTRKAPKGVIQPLPENTNEALKVLFFLYMPKIFRHLSRISLTAAQVFLPEAGLAVINKDDGTSFKCNVYKEIRVEGCDISWQAFYEQYQICHYHTPTETRSGTEGDLQLKMLNYLIPPKIGPSVVDDFYSKSDGVWFPDSLKFRMSWKGGSKDYDKKKEIGEFNPFAGRQEWYISHFTEPLSTIEKEHSLQWALIQSGLDNSSRGNLPIAKQQQKPQKLSKAEYLWFGKIRSYPHVQLRNVMIAISERSLPLSSCSVHTLLRQTIYHVGKISISSGETILEWKRDMEFGDFLISFNQIMKEFIDEIEGSPYKYKEAKIAAEISSFFSEWFSEFKDVSRAVAIAVQKWGDDCEEEIQKAEPSVVPSLRARQALFYKIAVFALLSGVVSKKDTAIAIKLIAKANNLFIDDKKDFKEDLINIDVLCEQMITEKSLFILSSIQDHTLSSVLKAVLPNCPSNIKWESWDAPSEKNLNGCFFSFIDSDGGLVMYSINVLSGIILVDGLPPHKLPLEILHHPLYKRTFGDVNFEVVLQNGILETVRHVKQNKYQFDIIGETLKVREISDDSVLELLDWSNLQKWRGTLPKRLQELHSHWFDRKRGFIFLRGENFEDRSIDFILEIVCPLDVDNLVECSCKRVPQHMKGYDENELTKLHSSFQQLVLHKSPVLNILSKFENEIFIHTYIEPEQISSRKKKVIFHLPRFDLEFEVRGSEIFCQEIVGFKLCEQQQLTCTLKGFSSYLVLEEGHKVSSRLKIILVPDGTIILEHNDMVPVKGDDSSRAQREWTKYKIHPRFLHITANQIASRIRLATLHIATSTLFPESEIKMTGEERTIQLLRQCWTNRPFSRKEQVELENLKRIVHGKSSVVSLLCLYMEKNSQQIEFLFNPKDIEHSSFTDCDEASAYSNFISRNDYGYRQKLTNDEERRTFGSHSYSKSSLPSLICSYDGEECPVDALYLESIQQSLDQGLEKNETTDKTVFPLSHIRTKNSLEVKMKGELCWSWMSYENSKVNSCANLPKETLEFILRGLSVQRGLLEHHIIGCLHWSPDASKEQLGLQINLHRLVNYYPTVALSDFPMLVCETSEMLNFNPFLSEKGRKNIKVTILRWLQCCVMEDKLNRLIEYSINPNKKEDFIKELENGRTWTDDPKLYWLAFEVEGQIQIRPDQYAIANHLIDNPGHIVQLNMGMGKSRVIIPMILLHWHFNEKDKVVRLHVLSSLFSEAVEFLHSTCCASVLSVKLYMLPFCREIELDERRIKAIMSTIHHCQNEGGTFIVEPEHRLSLELKWKTMQLDHKRSADDLGKIIHETPWYNILDESDEILHHRFQLIYAHGKAWPLPEGSHRYKAAQTLLEIISKENVDILISNKQNNSVDFPSFVIAADIKLDSSILSTFRKQVTDAMLKNLPLSLKWMGNHIFIEHILSLIIETQYDAQIKDLNKECVNDILALRGLLAGDILLHCLMKRHRVEYGIARPGKKRIAIPFRGADTPSYRSEFAHPDCAIVLTMLAYYSDGLSREELEEALQKLLSVGISERRHNYNAWFELSSSYMSSEDKSRLDKVEKIDLSNSSQLGVLLKHFRKNPRTINFWLNTCVFPTELQQYSNRLTASARHLTNIECGSTIGFSGTNDNHRILPLEVEQYFSKKQSMVWRQIEGTNGKMVDLILRRTIKCEPIGSGLPRKEFLTFIKNNIRKIHVIIDCGALLAGMENIDVARSIMEFLPKDIFRGVTFFHKARNQWMILEHSGALLGKSMSPIRERDTFVIFDEARCRGADMKLKPDAVAALSIGPSICKDKLMQGAGRMRQLENDQKLIIVGVNNVFQKIKDITLGTNAINVLEWTMKNTFEATRKGIPNWANQGMYFSTTENNVEHYLLQEKASLEDFYGKRFESKKMVDFVAALIENAVKQVGGSTDHSTSIESKIMSLTKLIDDDKHASIDGVDEECEREMEIEIEEEEEFEREIPLMSPRKETDWKWEDILHASNPFDLSIKIHSLHDFVKKYLSQQNLSKIKFSERVFLSRNFATSVSNQISDLDDYLRLVDTAVIFSSGDCVLVSERESDFIVRTFWKHNRSINLDKCPILIHFSMLRRAYDLNEPVRLSLHPSKQIPANSFFAEGPASKGLLTVREMKEDENKVASIQLFAGETTYKTKKRQDALQHMLKAAMDSESTLTVDPREFVYMRGYFHYVEYSDLESNWEEVKLWASSIALQKKKKKGKKNKG